MLSTLIHFAWSHHGSRLNISSTTNKFFFLLFILTLGISISGCEESTQTEESAETVTTTERSELSSISKEAITKLKDRQKAKRLMPEKVHTEYLKAMRVFTKINATKVSDKEFILLTKELEGIAGTMNEFRVAGIIGEACTNDCHSSRMDCRQNCQNNSSRRFCGCASLSIICGFCCFLCGSIPDLG